MGCSHEHEAKVNNPNTFLMTLNISLSGLNRILVASLKME